MMGLDYKTPNNEQKMPADDSPDVKLFMSDIIEEYRCFGKLEDEEMTRLSD